MFIVNLENLFLFQVVERENLLFQNEFWSGQPSSRKRSEKLLCYRLNLKLKLLFFYF